MPVRVLEASFLLSAQDLSGAPEDELPEFCFLGRSNVGKSSMINALLGRRKLARVSNTPGRTRLLNFFSASVEGDAGTRMVSICDLPGYGYAKVPKAEAARWQPMIERYLAGRPSLRGAVVLLDARREPTPTDRGLLAWLAEKGRPVLVVATKLDKLAKAHRFAALQAIDRGLGLRAGSAIGFSSELPIGRDDVWTALLSLA